MSSSPVFIVGTPRSGTTLLAAILANHSAYSCGPETHFFSYLTKKIEKKLLNPKNWPYSAADFICSLKLENEYIYKLYSITKEEIIEFLKNREPSIPAVLESLTLQHANKQKKYFWIEKTPRHLLFIPQILKYYPNAKIIRIIRDCRDVSLSLLKVPWGYKTPLQGVYRCWLDEICSQKFSHSYFLVKFEDLLMSPEKTLKNICNFLGVPYEPSMLRYYNASARLCSEKEWWKNLVKEPINVSRAFRWKKELDEKNQLMLTYFARNLLIKYGYEIDFVPEPKQTIFLFPVNFHFLESYEELFLKFAHQKIRILGCPSFGLLRNALSYEKPSKILFKVPLLISDIGNSFSRKNRVVTMLSFLNLISSLLRNNGLDFYYVDHASVTDNLGILDRILNGILIKLIKPTPYSLLV